MPRTSHFRKQLVLRRGGQSPSFLDHLEAMPSPDLLALEARARVQHIRALSWESVYDIEHVTRNTQHATRNTPHVTRITGRMQPPRRDAAPVPQALPSAGP